MKKFFRFILLIINLVFVVLLLLSTLSGVLTPEKHGWIALLSYGYFPLLLCNVAFIIVWLMMGRWEFLVSAVAIVLRISFVGLFFQTGGCSDVEPTDDSLKVLSFNTHTFEGLDGDDAMTADSGMDIFFEMIDEEQPDVMCLQECFFHRPFYDSLKVRGYRYHYGNNGRGKNSPSVVISRWPIRYTSPENGATKFFVDIEKNGHTVRVCCVHLDSYKMDKEDLEVLQKLAHAQMLDTMPNTVEKLKRAAREHQVEWDSVLRPMLENSRVPVVLAGDFNDTPASYIYQQATKLFVDSYVEQGRGFGTTYHGPYPAFRIDYILHSPSMKTLSYKRIKTSISDHYPIVASVELVEN